MRKWLISVDYGYGPDEQIVEAEDELEAEQIAGDLWLDRIQDIGHATVLGEVVDSDED